MHDRTSGGSFLFLFLPFLLFKLNAYDQRTPPHPVRHILYDVRVHAEMN